MLDPLAFGSQAAVDEAPDFQVCLVPGDTVYYGSFEYDRFALVFAVYLSFVVSQVSLSLSLCVGLVSRSLWGVLMWVRLGI